MCDCNPACVAVVTRPSLLHLALDPALTPPCPLVGMAPGRVIRNLTVKPNSNYANVSWNHNFPAGSSEFQLEFTLDSKIHTQFVSELRLDNKKRPRVCVSS